MNGYIEIKGIMDEYISLMDKLITFEKEKLQAIQGKKTEELDAFLKEEQAYLLQLRGLDQKREKIQKENGFEGMTYRQIIAKAQGDMQHDLDESFQQLDVKTKEFKELIKTINSYIDIKLHTIDAVMEKFGAEPPAKTPQSGVYDRISKEQETTPMGLHKFKSTKA